MVSTGDTAPDISATVGTSDHESFELAEHLGDGPVVLAFFPGAFTPPCTNEMIAFQEHADDFAAVDATILGISVLVVVERTRHITDILLTTPD